MSNQRNSRQHLDDPTGVRKPTANRFSQCRIVAVRAVTSVRLGVPGLLTIAALLAPSIGLCNDSRSTQQDAAQAEAFLSCDRQAERENAEASKLTPVAPTSVLNPILLLNDMHQRKLEQDRQPRLLEQIELKRQQCRQNVLVAAARKAQEVIDRKSDAARGYKAISFETFALDAKSLAATQARVSMRGSYLPDGNLEWLFPSQLDAIQARSNPGQARNAIKVPLVTDDAARDFRRVLLQCKATPGADQVGCPAIVTGRVDLCSIRGPLGTDSDVPCVVVENGRQMR